MDLFSKLTRWYFAKNALPYWVILFVDCAILLGTSVFVFMLENGVSATLPVLRNVVATMCCYLVFYLVGFRVFRTYSGMMRYSSFVDLQRIGFALLLGVLLVGICNALLPESWPVVRLRISGLVMIYLLSAALMWTIRVLVKYMYDVTYRSKQAQRIFIYGVREGGVGLAKSIRNQHPPKYVVEGFISNERGMNNRMLMGVKVYEENDELISYMRKKGVEAVFVSPLRSETFREDERLVRQLTEAGIRIYMMPAAREWDRTDELNHTQLREVDIEDLLPRDKIEVDMEAVGRLLEGRRILITGAAGSIGSEMVRQIAAYHPAELVLIDQAETPLHDIRLMMVRCWPELSAVTLVTSITNRSRMEEVFRTYRPEYVFHAAAYKHVPMMENNPCESVQNNIYGTRVVADLAVKYGTRKFVMISTDKAVNPTNVMGCSKRICEIYVQSLDQAIKEGRVQGGTQFVTTRFGNVLGSNGSVIPLFKEQIKNGGPVTVTDPNIIRFFMLIPEACKLVLEAGTMGNGGEIFVFDMGKPVRIADLAQRMILLSGAKNVEIKYTGLRDGEKLYEEVLNDAELTKPTFHPKIKIAAVREYAYDAVCRDMDRLLEVSHTYDDMLTVKVMKEMVPEFKSRHSKYEQLDGESACS